MLSTCCAPSRPLPNFEFRYSNMLTDFIYAVGMILFFLIIGIPLARIFLGRLDATKVFIAILAGFAITTVCGSWLVATRLDPVWLLPVLSLLVPIAYAVMRLKGLRLERIGIKKEFGSFKNFGIYLITILASGAAYISLQNNQLLHGRLAFRNGPDLVGWVSAAKYLCREKSISLLAHSIRNQLGVPDALMAFRDATKFPSTSIYQIPSYTEQINGEFLVGAHRYGIPGVQAGLCRILGTSSLYHSAVALMAMSGILVAILATLIVKDFTLRMDLKVATIFLAAVNVNIVSVAMEGGYGQLLATPFLLLCVLTGTSAKWRSRYMPIAVFLIVAFGLSAYVDVLFTAAAFLLVFFIVQSRQKVLPKKVVPGWAARVSVATAIGLVAGWPLWASLPRLILERVRGAGSIGGWDQGRLPFPADFWGFFNWLPSDGVHNVPRGVGLGIVELGMSLFILYIAARSRQREFKNFVTTSFFLYLILLYIVYKGGPSGANNYAIWKMSAYLSSLMMLAIAATGSTTAQLDDLDSTVGNTKKSKQLFVSSALVVALFSTLGWSVSWIGLRQFSLRPETSREQVFFNNYDVRIIGFNGANPAKFVLNGDIHFNGPFRGFEIPVRRSLPSRPLAYLLPTSSCQTLACIEAIIGPIPSPVLARIGPSALRLDKIVNGDFQNWSHGTRFEHAGETADKWLWATMTGGVISQEAFTRGMAPVPNSLSPFYLRWSITSDSHDYEILEKIKDARTFVGQTVVLSFWARQTMGATTFQTRIFQDFGTGGSPSSLTQADGGGAFAITPTWKRFMQVFTVPSTLGKTVGTNGDSFLWVSYQAGSTKTGQLDLWRVQLLPLGERKLKKVYTSNEFNAYE